MKGVTFSHYLFLKTFFSSSKSTMGRKPSLVLATLAKAFLYTALVTIIFLFRIIWNAVEIDAQCNA